MLRKEVTCVKNKVKNKKVLYTSVPVNYRSFAELAKEEHEQPGYHLQAAKWHLEQEIVSREHKKEL